MNPKYEKYLEIVINWWRMDAKVWALYILLLYLALSPFIKQFPLIAGYLPDDKYAIPMIAACLFFIMQIFMVAYKGENKDVSLKKFEDSIDGFKKRIQKAKQIDIVCSSSETFYPILKEVFSKQKIVCRMILRHPFQSTERQRNAMKHYFDSYETIKEENKECGLIIKYSSNTFSRMIIIDSAEVYFGFYRLDNGRLRANDFEMIHAKSGNYFGNFILNLARNRFESLWDGADDKVGEREKLVY